MEYSPLRKVAHLTLFVGWAFPLLLARLVPGRTAELAPEVVRMFRIVGGGWAFLAVTYGCVLALRLRRGIAG